MVTVIGPFTQVVTLRDLPLSGPIDDAALEVIPNADIVTQEGKIIDVTAAGKLNAARIEVCGDAVALPGWVDAHTHLCFAGSRAKDYSLRISGISYQQIAADGGGILDTVRHTRAATTDVLLQGLLMRLQRAMELGVTTCEVKSGYGLSVESELRLLRIIQIATAQHPVDVISTCLAAHTVPPEFADAKSYLNAITSQLLPIVWQEGLARRVDVFVEEHAIPMASARSYLQQAKHMGFDLCLHADQFSRGGAQLAAELGAASADHLEASTTDDFLALRNAHVTAVVLPGATLGLGMPFPAARAMLDQGLSVAIASDWNPGSAPMGDLLTQAALLSARQKLTTAETLSALTFRAAHALRLNDRGRLTPGQQANIVQYPCSDYREILYYQGSLKPNATYISGRKVHAN